ncbi:MAG: AAA family ATPase, partial [bacterium]
MLNRITISNLATIHSLELELERGFTVLTGETGAGKSILIEALRFVLGAKTSAEQIRTGAAQAMVEAAFDIGSHPEARKTLADLEIPADGELVLRRTIQANGRSRAVANDCGITQQKLEGLGALLVNIHGQHDNQMLLNPETHIRFVDAFGGLEAAREEVGRAHQQYSRLLRERKNLLEQAEQRERRQHELREEIAELRAANISEGEEKELRRENAVLTNGETLIGLTGAVCEELYEGENAVLSRLAAQEALLAQAAAIDVTLQPLLEQLRPLNLAVEDIYHTLNAYSARLESEPGRLDEVNDRLAGIEKIKRRYGQTVPAVLQRLADNEHELETLEEGLERLESLNGEIAKVAGGLHDLSGNLSAGRKKAAAELDRLILEQFQELGMEKASFETRIKPLFGQDGKTPLHTFDGKERLEFLLTTNPGQDLRPLFRIA